MSNNIIMKNFKIILYKNIKNLLFNFTSLNVTLYRIGNLGIYYFWLTKQQCNSHEKYANKKVF